MSAIIAKAKKIAQKAHAGQKRLNGEPYFSHLEKTAELVAKWGLDEATVAAAYLHDAIEDTPLTLEQIQKEFGDEIAFLVNGVTKIGHAKYQGIKAEMENMRKFILAVSQDVRVILIKLADRFHNIQTLYALPANKRKRIAAETMEIYVPLAYRLGMFKFGGELEDLAFAHLYPKELQWLQQNVKEHYQQQEAYIKQAKPLIKEELEKNQVKVIRIDSRAKRYASLWRKLQKYEMNLNRVYDLVAVRCIVPTVEDCYTALGVIHNRWLPLPGRFKDYIALPKANGYQSLHTTVFGPQEKIMEIQIRTPKMHQEAEYGVAAYWSYQETKSTKKYLRRQSVIADKKEWQWIQQLSDWQQKEIKTPKEFIRSFKIDFLEDRILTLTPQGKVVELPAGSTPIDFAYKIHSEIGDACVGARINGVIAPLNSKLKSGDIVEILTQKNKSPSADWLEFVKTSNAKNRIRSALKRKHRQMLNTAVKNKVEFKILVEDRIGILKDITTAISRSHVNITAHQSSKTSFGEKFHVIKICCALADAKKIEKLKAKIQKLKGVKRVDYHHV